MPSFKLKIKISWNYLIKGVVYAAILMLGPLVGVLMRLDDAQGFSIWGVVGTLNVLAIIFVFYMLKQDFQKAKEKEQSKFGSAKDRKEKKAKAEISKEEPSATEKSESKTNSEPSFETDADKKK